MEEENLYKNFLNLANAFMEEKQYRNATSCLSKAGEYLFEKKQYKKAFNHFKDIVIYFSNLSSKNDCNIKKYLKKHIKIFSINVLKCFGKFNNEDKKNPEYLIIIGQCCEKLKKREKAVYFFNKAYKLKEESKNFVKPKKRVTHKRNKAYTKEDFEKLNIAINKQKSYHCRSESFYSLDKLTGQTKNSSLEESIKKGKNYPTSRSF